VQLSPLESEAEKQKRLGASQAVHIETRANAAGIKPSAA
jgi:hypothetical protein